MGDLKRVFILGAGFSNPAGMPLATELLPLLLDKLQLSERRKWVDDLCRRLAVSSNAVTPMVRHSVPDAHSGLVGR